jgi:hypothetical protein
MPPPGGAGSAGPGGTGRETGATRRAVIQATVLGGVLAATTWIALRADDPPSVDRSAGGGPPDFLDLRDGFRGDVDPGSSSPAFRRLLASAGEGSVLYVPPGEWVIDEAVDVFRRGITVVGAGMRTTRLRVAEQGSGGVPFSAVNISASGVAVERLTIVGDPANTGHGVRVVGDADEVSLHDLVIEDVGGYGIGLQGGRASGGLFNGFSCANVTILRCGNDGIDMKNYDPDNDSCRADAEEDGAAVSPACTGGRSFLRNISIDGHGQAQADKRGIDIRGRRQLQNIDVLNVAGPASGIVFRPEVGGPPNGEGGRWSTLENYFVTKVPGSGVSVDNDDLEGVVISNGNTVELTS